jgi:anti-sigma factor RsiW
VSDSHIPCVEIVELVSDYLDGELDAQMRRRVEEHLTLCPACQVYVEQVRDTVRKLKRLPEDELPPHAVAELEAAFAAFRRSGP